MSNTQQVFHGFYAAQATIDDYAPTALTGRAIYRFSPTAKSRVPLHVRTGAQSLGNPTERKRFGYIEFHGKGTLFCRVYVDGVYICQKSVTLTESPSKIRNIGIPVGTKGYTMDVEFSGDADIRAVEYAFKPMDGTS